MHLKVLLRVCRDVDEALERGSPAVIDSDLRKASLSACEALSLHRRLTRSVSARNSCNKLLKPDKRMCQTRVWTLFVTSGCW